MDLLQWMGAVRMRVQTADKNHHDNPQVIHATPSINIFPLSIYAFYNVKFLIRTEICNLNQVLFLI